ncbi:MAG TPA: type VI secretion system tip protein VgrG [Bacteroidia bacterium]|jgi:Rhs element Vgr protein|nr:type VI secretion system tip protein VgrG [Bacteroidia bacterium]
MPLSQTLPGTQNTDLVTFTIKVNGTAINTQYQVKSIGVINELNRIPSATLMIYDGDAAKQDFAVSNEPTFAPGTDIEILAGYHSDETSVFKGIIVHHKLKVRNDKSAVLILTCRDKAIKMSLARKNKYYYNQKDSDVAQTIIGTYGLDKDIEDTSATLPSIVQFDCSDWDFLISRMEANGKFCMVNAGKITAKKPVTSGSTVLDAVFGATMLEFDADINPLTQYTGVTAKTWDYSNQQINSVQANDPGFDENGNLSSTTLAGVSGVSEYDLFVGEEIKSDELQNWANARFGLSKLSRCRGRVRLRGYGQINPFDLINIGGVGDRFNGKVFVSGVRHEIVDGIWTTDIQFGIANELFTRTPDVSSPTAADLLPAVQGLQIGIVTKLQGDPDGEHRIQVRLPIVDPNEQGIWMRVACLDAGNNRGAFFRPEINDEVIVGFVNNDPRHAVVLGMLNSSAKPAPLTASDQNDQKGYVSRSGMKMMYDDSAKSIVVQTPAGKKITVSEQTGEMSLEDENGNSIKMTAASINIQSAADITLNATGNLTLQAVNITLSPSASFSASAGGASISAGSGSAAISAPTVSVSGSGTTTISGGMVMIN